MFSPSTVIYDSCPKTITQGIWWPRTKFNLPAAVPCPKGSVGPYRLTNTHKCIWTHTAREEFQKSIKRLVPQKPRLVSSLTNSFLSINLSANNEPINVKDFPPMM